ncbi:hypothetical protein SAMN04515671_1355 [Nakamurella panacisegetis]|uniref:Uncharacterized protein n=1 Tax=Nakamurella panacisegetis TaxID=1090615 RepID=A0A1H0KL64_9ACTN|nr:hypothetical protein SAMN04515671_1355 [Nakamurella panacisegetis]
MPRPRRFLKVWRPIVFGGLFVASTTFGLAWHFTAKSQIPTLSAAEPLRIEAWASDPTVPIRIQVEVVPHLYATGISESSEDSALETLSVQAERPVDVLIITNRQDRPQYSGPQVQTKPKFQRSADWNHIDAARDIEDQWAYVAHIAGGFKQFDESSIVGDFDGEPGAVYSTTDAFNARMPEIADNEFGNPYRPAYAFGPESKTDDVSQLTGPEPGGDHIVPNDFALSHWPISGPPYPTINPRVLFWEPQALTSSELLVGASDALVRKSIRDSGQPSGVLQGGEFTWQGTYSLRPSLEAVSPEADDRHSRLDFLSGVALATAAAAFIALVQERWETKEGRASGSRATDRDKSTRKMRLSPASTEILGEVSAVSSSRASPRPTALTRSKFRSFPKAAARPASKLASPSESSSGAVEPAPPC